MNPSVNVAISWKKAYLVLSVLVFALLLAGLAPSAFAAENEAPLKGGQVMPSGVAQLQPMAESDFEYEIEDGQATITGYNGTASSVSIPSTIGGAPVIAIGENAFEYQETLKSVAIPDGVTSVGFSAFSGCENLASVSLPDSVTQIDAYAFDGCSALGGALALPPSLELLGSGAYRDTAITSVWVPSSLAGNQDSAFDGCESLSLVEFQAGTASVPDSLFAGCPGLRSVAIPDGVTSVGFSSFWGCENLTSVSLPDSVTRIDAYAFDGCTALGGALALPPSLELLGSGAYRDTAITSVWVPSSLAGNQDSAFDGCESLSLVEFQAGTASVPDSLFAGCPGLRSVAIPDGVTSVGFSAFWGCENLTSISFPQELETIEAYAFDSCTSLTSVTLPYLLKRLGNSAFCNCPSLSDVYAGKKITSFEDSFDSSHTVVHMPKFSDTTMTLIDADQQVLFTDSNFQDTDDKIVKLLRSTYEMNDSAGSEYLQLKLHYELKPAKAAQATNKKLRIKLPETSTLFEVRKDKTRLAEGAYELSNDNVITIPVSEMSGDVDICISPDEYGRVSSYAALTYGRSKTNATELIGAVGSDCMVLTMSVSDEVSFESGAKSVPVKVTGYGRAGKNVELYIDGKLAAETTVNNLGTYRASVSLSTPLDGKEYVVSAKSLNTKNEEVEVKGKTVTVEGAPKLTAFSLYIEAHDYASGHATFDLLDDTGATQYIAYQEDKPYKFSAKYDHRDKIKDVYVVSTRGGVSQRLKASWSESDQAYVTSGYFGNDSSYVPGIVSVEYTTYPEPSDMSKNDDIKLTAHELNSVPSEWRNAKAKQIQEEGADFAAQITLESGAEVTYTFQKMTFTEYAEELEQALPDEGLQTQGLQTQADSKWEDPDKDRVEKTKALIKLLKAFDQDGTAGISEIMKIFDLMTDESFRYYKVGGGDLMEDMLGVMKTEMTADKLVSYVIDPNQDDNYVCKYVVKKAEGKVEKTMYDLFGMDSATGDFTFSMGKEIFNYEMQQVDFAQNYFEIMSNPNLTEAQRQAQLTKLRGMMDIANEKLVFTYLASCLTVMAATSSVTGLGIAFGVAAVIIDKVIIPMIESGDFDKFVRGKLSLRSLIIRWIIDPSGYVYEGVTNNRVSGATVTVYYRESEDDTTPEVWNAQEYEQANPLTTDSGGNYAWNVPEGLWQVQASKDGYETATSEWLAVPPPQLDVNIKLNNQAAPTVTEATASGESVRVTFSQYMDPNTVSGLKVYSEAGDELAYQLAYDTTETDVSGNVYARSFVLRFTGARPESGAMITLGDLASAKSSSGVAAEGVDQQLTVGDDVHLVSVSSISMLPETTYELSATLTGYTGQNVSITSSAEAIASVVGAAQVDSNGILSATIQGNVLGDAVLTIAVEGTGIERKIPVSVCDEVAEGPEYDDNPAPIDLSSFQMSLSADRFEYDGAAKTPTVTVKNGDVALTEGTDFTVEYRNNVEVGQASAVVVGIGGYTGSKELSYQIYQEQSALRNIADCEAALSNARYTYDGTAKMPAVVVKDGGTDLTQGTHFTVEYANNTDAGSASATVAGMGDYTGSRELAFTIEPFDLGNLTAQENSGIEVPQLVADGAPQSPSVSVVFHGKELVQGTDYTLSGDTTFTQDGSYALVISGAGNFTGTVTWPYTVMPAQSGRVPQTITVDWNSATKAVGDPAFALVVEAKGNAPLSFTSSNTAVAKVTSYGVVSVVGVGTAKITVTAAETDLYQSATKTVTVTVNPKATSLTKVVNVKGKKMKVRWKKAAGVTGYIIQYSTAKNFKKALKKVTVKKASQAKTTIKKLTKKKKYFVRICTYKTVGGKTYTSKWSAVKSVKVKK